MAKCRLGLRGYAALFLAASMLLSVVFHNATADGLCAVASEEVCGGAQWASDYIGSVPCKTVACAATVEDTVLPKFNTSIESWWAGPYNLVPVASAQELIDAGVGTDTVVIIDKGTPKEERTTVRALGHGSCGALGLRRCPPNNLLLEGPLRKYHWTGSTIEFSNSPLAGLCVGAVPPSTGEVATAAVLGCVWWNVIVLSGIFVAVPAVDRVARSLSRSLSRSASQDSEEEPAGPPGTPLRMRDPRGRSAIVPSPYVHTGAERMDAMRKRRRGAAAAAADAGPSH